MRATHWSRGETLEQLFGPRVDDGEAHAPQTAAHQVHPEQPGYQEIYVARAGLCKGFVARAHYIAPAGGALQGVVSDHSGLSTFRTRRVISIVEWRRSRT